MAGQAVECYRQCRGVLENAAYAVHIHRDPALATVWLDRHQNGAGQPPHLRVIPTTGPGHGGDAALVERLSDTPQARYAGGLSRWGLGRGMRLTGFVGDTGERVLRHDFRPRIRTKSSSLGLPTPS
jgi:hypothetical protein